MTWSVAPFGMGNVLIKELGSVNVNVNVDVDVYTMKDDAVVEAGLVEADREIWVLC